MRFSRGILAATAVLVGALAWHGLSGGWPIAKLSAAGPRQARGHSVDAQLSAVLREAGFTGTVGSSLEERLGRALIPELVDLGRLVFFDNVMGLHEDNSCAGCHTPGFGFGDSQSIAIGVQNNGIVGPDRTGPRNQRRAPMAINSAFFPKLMWNGRFAANSEDPFDNSDGFRFPSPEGDALKFGPGDPRFPVLLAAQGVLPSTELVEMAGFTGASTNPFFRSSPHLHQFDDGLGTRLPNDSNHTEFADPGFLNEEIRSTVLHKLQGIPEYAQRFADLFNDGRTSAFVVRDWMVGQAIAEFEMAMTFADAPIDRFARGNRDAMSAAQKRGALLFFGKAGCVACHAVSGQANEMFSDFDNHVLGVPQIAPAGFGVGVGNVPFDGTESDEDFGTEHLTGDPGDRYKFRTSPLRNVALQPTFFHNGAFTRLDDAIRHHLDAKASARTYNAVVAGVDPDLTQRLGPIEPVLALLDPRLQEPIRLSRKEFDDLLAFVGGALLDARARPEHVCRTVPSTVPSALPVATFQGCR